MGGGGSGFKEQPNNRAMYTVSSAEHKKTGNCHKSAIVIYANGCGQRFINRRECEAIRSATLNPTKRDDDVCLRACLSY